MKPIRTIAVLTVAFVIGLVFVSPPESRAAVSYSVADSIYSQDFNTLPFSPEGVSLGNTPLGWIDDTTTPGTGQFSILGWYLYHPISVTEGGANGHQRFRIHSAPPNIGSFYSFGNSGSTERALGAIGANTLAPDGQAMYIGLRLRNDTGMTLTDFTLGYTGEQWRNGGNTEGLIFMWSTTASAISDPDSSFIPVAALNFNAPKNGGTATALDGNAAANRVVIGPVTVSGINWLPGTDLWLRWNDIQIAASADHGLAIDDLTFKAIPEPSSVALVGLGIAGLLGLRRPRKSKRALGKREGTRARVAGVPASAAVWRMRRSGWRVGREASRGLTALPAGARFGRRREFDTIPFCDIACPMKQKPYEPNHNLNFDFGPARQVPLQLRSGRGVRAQLACLALGMLALAACPSAQALQLQPLTTFGTNANGTIRPGDFDYPWLTSDGARYQRGMAYNPTTGHLIIVNRYPIGYETINIIDAFTGQEVGSLDVSSPAFGGSASFVYNMIGVADDGAIYVGNLNTVSTLVTFNLYRWANEGAPQTLVYSGDPRGGNTTANGRWGDSIAVRGSGVNTEVLITSRGSQAAILRPTDGSMTSFTATTLNTDVPSGDLGYALSFGAGNTFWAKAASSEGQRLYHLSYNLGAGTATILQAYSLQDFPGRVGAIAVHPGNNLLAAIDFTAGTVPDLMRLYDVANPANPPVFLDRKVVEVWTNANNIFSGAVAFGSTNVYALNSDNGIVAYTIADGSAPLAPLIFGNPSSRITQITSNTVFTVGVDGTAPLAYQWQFNGTNITGATNATLTLTNITVAAEGDYSVVITNDYGAVTSAVAKLTVLPNFGDLLVYDPFDYPVGTMLPGQGGWTVTSANANGAVQAGNLVVPGLLAPVGNRYTWTNTSSVRKPFGQYNAGEVYCSFAFRLDTAPTGTGNETTAGFSYGTSTTFPLKINIIGDGAGKYRFGLYKGPGTTDNGQIDSQLFNPGETVFIVARYVFRAGANADTCDLWINPTPATFGAAAPPPATLADIGAGVSQSWSYIDRFFWRWGTAGYPNRVSDELRVGFSWAEVTPPAPPSLAIAVSGNNVILSWPTNNSSGYVLQDNPHVADSEGWEPVGQSPVVQGQNYTVTVAASGTRYFRLKK